MRLSRERASIGATAFRRVLPSRPARIIVGAGIAWIGLTIVLVLPIRWIPPSRSAFMLREAALGTEPIRYDWVAWDSISPHLPIAAVAAEDQRFPEHFGFDFDSIAEAWQERRSGGRSRGASTISQQVAKNLYLWPGQSFLRKGLEAWCTLAIELLWPKQRILEVYLNIAEFGPGVFGVAEASRHAFDREPGDLTAAQAATLIAVLPSPKRMSAASPSEYVRRRARDIQRQVRNLGGPLYLESR